MGLCLEISASVTVMVIKASIKETLSLSIDVVENESSITLEGRFRGGGNS